MHHQVMKKQVIPLLILLVVALSLVLFAAGCGPL
jgi:hypothetical protein